MQREGQRGRGGHARRGVARAGSFCWIELATRDQAGAKQFYQALFGWGADDLPMGAGALLSDPQGASFYVIKLTGLGH